MHYKSDIDLKDIKNNKNFRQIDQEKEILFNKLIKSEIYKKIIYKYKLHKNNITLYNYYDDIIIFLLKKSKINLKKKNINAIIKNNIIINNLSLSSIINNEMQKINDSIFYINFIFDNTNNEDKKYVFEEFINNLSIIYNRHLKIKNNSIQLIEKFINCPFINNVDKDELLFLYNSLIN